MTAVTQTVLLGTALLGGAAGMLGSFAVLRRRALIGDVLAHAALPGLCLSVLIFGERNYLALLVGAFIAGLAAVASITFVCRWTRTKEDAAIGIVLSTFFGGGVVLLSVIQQRADISGKAGLDSYIYGQAAGMIRQDLWTIVIVSVLALGVMIALYKEFKTFSFDPDFARAQGWPTVWLDLIMMGTLALITVVGLPAVGVVLMAAMLIIPAAAARFWTNRLGPMILVSGVAGCATGLCGTLISSGQLEAWLGFDPLAFGQNTQKLPTGPVIVMCGTAIFLVSMLFAPQRGVVARLWAELRLRRTIARENLLRSLYELTEPQLPARREIPLADLLAHRAWRPGTARALLSRAARRGLVERTPSGVRLTESGLARASALTRTHRLWELYLIQGAGIAADHVDRDADSIEHFLTPQIARHLEAELAAVGRLPATEEVPGSPHDLK